MLPLLSHSLYLSLSFLIPSLRLSFSFLTPSFCQSLFLSPYPTSLTLSPSLLLLSHSHSPLISLFLTNSLSPSLLSHSFPLSFFAKSLSHSLSPPLLLTLFLIPSLTLFFALSPSTLRRKLLFSVFLPGLVRPNSLIKLSKRERTQNLFGQTFQL